MVVRTCKNCGVEFAVSASGRGGRNREYCSDKCRREYAAVRRTLYQHTCLQCGKVFETVRRTQIYCSSNCRALARRTLKGTVRICIICGREYEPKRKEQECCGKECAKKKEAETKRSRILKVCKGCGKVFDPGKHKENVYCSRKCANKNINAKKAKPKESKKNPVCIICGREFKGRVDYKCCSDECRKEKNRQDTRKNAEVKHKLRNKWVKCKYCGREFEPEYGTKRRQFCSDKCQAKHAKRQRKARKKKQFVEEVSLAYIYERDGGRCQICGKKVNLKYQVPHPLAVTLDHIIPLADGGLHEKKNVQLAHFVCNCRRSNKGYGQLRLFG